MRNPWFMEGSISATVQSKISSGILYAVPVFHLAERLKQTATGTENALLR